jgi:UPF0755 protein
LLIAYRHLLQRAKIIVLGVFLFVALIFIGTFLAFLRTPLVADDATTPVDFIFPSGSSMVHLSDRLHTLGLFHYPKSYLLLLASIMHASNHLHAGEYQIQPGTTAVGLLQDMVAGRVVWRDFLFTEGATLKQLRQALDNNPYLIHQTHGLSQAQLAKLLKIQNKHLEGLFFPDTYRYTAGLTDTSILQKAYQSMQTHLAAAWRLRAANVGYQNSYQALIVASLVEKEAKLPSDRPKIAGVILKRLKMAMPLQVDATVIYGLGDAYDGKLKIAQLKMPSLYNSYLNKGLPPTPIAMPGEASLQAAMHPIISNNLFYVARGDGGHTFSATLAGQNRAVKHYRALEHGYR